MSQCPQCFVGHCKKHPLQDSGKRKQIIMDQEKKLGSIYDKMIQDKLREAAGAFGSSGTTDREQAAYRERMMSERDRAEKRPRKELKGGAAELAASGINGTTMQVMMGIGSDSDDGDDEGGGGKRKRKEKKSKDPKKDSKKGKKVGGLAGVFRRFFCAHSTSRFLLRLDICLMKCKAIPSPITLTATNSDLRSRGLIIPRIPVA